MTDRLANIVEVDVRELGNPAVLIHLAKETRYLSRGTTVVAHANDERAAIDFSAWAEWAGHAIGPIEPDPEGGYTVCLTILEGRTKGQRAIEDSVASMRRTVL